MIGLTPKRALHVATSGKIKSCLEMQVRRRLELLEKHAMRDEEQQVSGIEFLHAAAMIPVDPGAIVYHSEAGGPPIARIAHCEGRPMAARRG